MKRLVLCCAVLFALTSTVHAQMGSIGPSIAFGVQGDAVNLNLPGIYSDIYGLGLGGGVHFDVKFGLLAFRVSGDYLTLSPDKNKYIAYAETILPPALASSINISGGRIDVYSANLNLKWTLLPLPIIHVYATGGAGYVRLTTADATVTIPGLGPFTVHPAIASQNKPALNAGAGVDLHLFGFDIYGELKLNWIMTEGKTSTEVPLATVGLTF